MKRYRIIQRTHNEPFKMDILCECMLEEEASEALQTFKATYPDKTYKVEEYNFDPEGSHWGRDPDLH